jgi:hypothetical protein
MAVADAYAEKSWRSNQIEHVRYHGFDRTTNYNQLNYKSALNDEGIFFNQPVEKAFWLTKSPVSKKTGFKIIPIKDGYEIKLPISLVKLLENQIKESMYILDLQDNWDGENSKSYNIESWLAGVQFTIDFYLWLTKIYNGKFYVPKIYHGPNGSIDIMWRENDFRLFINIDAPKNSGSYYSDKSTAQFSEGQFPSLKNIDFHLVIPPILF